MKNYKRISLMGTVLKVLMVILSDRLKLAFECEKLLSPEQAEFRRLEECITQAACLSEIAGTRTIAKLET